MEKNFIGERITSLRLNEGISEYKLSKNIGKCNNYINKVASGSITPTLDSLLAICEYFGITLAQFFQDESTSVSLTAEKIIAIVPHISEDKLQSLLTIVNSLKE
ncbi:MAG: helix-turn-helix transcriptional regulator [Lachnospiraceae bacterium]|jgi:transcriptional regulator with XRE-family HTH domain|nr:helix-turn-helix transcriptional regulator [Lachnospiraceae bacterium]